MMHHSAKWRRFLIGAGLMVLLLVVSGAVQAAESKEILQAVKSGVPNTADNRVVLAELFAADW